MKHRPSTFAPAGQTTQMIVGVSSSPDAVLLRTASELSPTSSSAPCRALAAAGIDRSAVYVVPQDFPVVETA